MRGRGRGAGAARAAAACSPGAVGALGAARLRSAGVRAEPMRLRFYAN